MPMCAVVLPVPAAVRPVRSITLSVSTPEAETLYRHPMPSVTLPSDAFQVPLTNVSDSSKVASTVVSAFITRSHGAVDAVLAHAPPQALNVEPGLAVAVTRTLLPGTEFGLPAGPANPAPP